MQFLKIYLVDRTQYYIIFLLYKVQQVSADCIDFGVMHSDL